MCAVGLVLSALEPILGGSRGGVCVPLEQADLMRRLTVGHLRLYPGLASMKVRVLGCSGGIGGVRLRTTSLLVDRDILIDAGTGVGDLTLLELAAVDHVFLTHAHLDHIACLPLLIDSVADLRQAPLNIYGAPAVLETLRRHIFNWQVWPDFTQIPEPSRPALRFQPVEVGEVLDFAGRRICPLPVDHTVPALAYHLDSGEASLVFSGDTGPCPQFWVNVAGIGNLRHLLVECAFPDQQRDLAVLSRHLCPALLAEGLAAVPEGVEIHITHLKPGLAETTMAEIRRGLKSRNPRMLQTDRVIEF